MPRTITVQVAQLLVGDELASGATVTMLSPSSRHQGERFISARLPDGRHWGTTLPSHELVTLVHP